VVERLATAERYPCAAAINEFYPSFLDVFKGFTQRLTTSSTLRRVHMSDKRMVESRYPTKWLHSVRVGCRKIAQLRSQLASRKTKKSSVLRMIQAAVC